ncbi:MAG: proteasome assembly chaperone 4 family protein [Candidatus Bathyarchaeia archaeon]
MYKAKVFHEEVVEDGKTLLATVIELGNSYIVFLSEGEENLGTLSISIPMRPEISRLPVSSVILGERHIVSARSIAERLAAVTKKIVLVSVFVKTIDEMKVGQIFIRLLEKILKKSGGQYEP